MSCFRPTHGQARRGAAPLARAICDLCLSDRICTCYLTRTSMGHFFRFAHSFFGPSLSVPHSEAKAAFQRSSSPIEQTLRKETDPWATAQGYNITLGDLFLIWHNLVKELAGRDELTG